MEKKNYFPILTHDERVASIQAAQEERERLIQEAINNGAKVNYMSSRLTQDEMETHIRINNDGECVIDTTIARDITKCMKRGWKITHVTYYQGTKQVAGITFTGNASNISIRNI